MDNWPRGGAVWDLFGEEGIQGSAIATSQIALPVEVALPLNHVRTRRVACPLLVTGYADSCWHALGDDEVSPEAASSSRGYESFGMVPKARAGYFPAPIR